MGKPHGKEGRYAVLRLATACLREVRLGMALAGLVLACCPCAVALDPALDVSQYAHTAWKVRDGFFKGEILAIAQTPDGYLWLGTAFGLLRFDGVRAVPCPAPLEQYLHETTIRSLLVTRDGTLWIGADKGLASWKNSKLTQYQALAGLYIFSLLEDRDGTVWVGAVASTGKLCAMHNGTTQCYGDDGTLGRGVARLYEDRKGNLWVGVESGLWRWKHGPPKFYPLAGEPNGIQALGEDSDGALLVGWKGGIQRFVDGKTEPYPLPGLARQLRAHRILRDYDGSLWIGTVGQGIGHVHQGRIDVLSPSDGLSSDIVNDLFEDREGNIWVATVNGLDRFRDFAVATFFANQGLLSDTIGSVLADRDGSVWIGTYGGLNQWKNGQITVPPTGSAKRDGKLDGLVPNSLFQDDRGRVWVSTNLEFGYLEKDRFVPISGLPGGLVLAITQGRAGNLLIANETSGLFRVSPRNEVEQIPWSKFGHQDHASVLAPDRTLGVWIGFFLGGIAYFADGKVRASYTAADGLGAGRVSGFLFDQEGALWVATGGGLSRLKNGRIATLTSENGLPCDAVHWVMEDDARSFWLYAACGLVRINRSELEAWVATADKDAKRTVQATVFDGSDGVRSLANAGHYSPQVAKTPGGSLWFLRGDGVSVIDPHRLPFNKIPPPVHIEQITADRKSYDPAAYGNGRVPLPPRLRDVEIDYTALSLVAPEKIHFRYKLEGRDSDWQDAGNRRQAFYTDLPPRNYRFRVMACNNSGVWNEAGAFLDFSVAPAYYQTIWFRLSLVAAFLALLWGLYQLRLQQLAREFNAGLDARVSERTRIARELHDSLLQGFQGLMFRLQAVRDLLPGQPSEAMSALDTALERGDKAIAEGRDTVSDLREPIMGDSGISQALTALGEELALQSANGTAPCVCVLVEGAQRELNPILRDELYRIAREALRNAFRHAKAQKIEAEITYGDSEFLLHVRDDGSGIDPKVANQGARAGHWGLPGMRERAKSFGGKLEVWSEHGAGTEIELTVPASIAYDKSERRRKLRFWPKKIGGANGQQSQGGHRS